MPALNTAVVFLLIVYLHPNGVVRVCREPGATDDPLMVLLTMNNTKKMSASSHTFLKTITHVCGDQCRVLDGAGFGNDEGTHVENIDAMELAEELETLETSRLLDISGDVTGF